MGPLVCRVPPPHCRRAPSGGKLGCECGWLAAPISVFAQQSVGEAAAVTGMDRRVSQGRGRRCARAHSTAPQGRAPCVDHGHKPPSAQVGRLEARCMAPQAGPCNMPSPRRRTAFFHRTAPGNPRGRKPPRRPPPAAAAAEHSFWFDAAGARHGGVCRGRPAGSAARPARRAAQVQGLTTAAGRCRCAFRPYSR